MVLPDCFAGARVGLLVRGGSVLRLYLIVDPDGFAVVDSEDEDWSEEAELFEPRRVKELRFRVGADLSSSCCNAKKFKGE